jgi:hypothetical protein
MMMMRGDGDGGRGLWLWLLQEDSIGHVQEDGAEEVRQSVFGVALLRSILHYFHHAADVVGRESEVTTDRPSLVRIHICSRCVSTFKRRREKSTTWWDEEDVIGRPRGCFNKVFTLSGMTDGKERRFLNCSTAH